MKTDTYKRKSLNHKNVKITLMVTYVMDEHNCPKLFLFTAKKSNKNFQEFIFVP